MNRTMKVILRNAKVWRQNFCLPPIRRFSSDEINLDSDSHKGKDDSLSEEMKSKILKACTHYINQHGWTSATIAAGAEHCGMPGTLHGLFPNPDSTLVFYMYKTFNEKLSEEMSKNQRQNEKVEEYLVKYLRKRLEMIIPYFSRWPEAMEIMSRPGNVTTSGKYLLQLVDDLWYYAGDRSVDFSWYTRRVPLMGVYVLSQLHLIQDKSDNFEETWSFVKRRMQDVRSTGGLLSQVQNNCSIAGNAAYSAYHAIRNVAGMNSPAG